MNTTIDSRHSIGEENVTCERVLVPKFINKTEYCREPVHFKCPVYPCFLDGTELVVSVLGFVLNLSTVIALFHIGRKLKPRYRLLLSLSCTDMVTAALHIVSYFYIFPSVFINSYRFVSVSMSFGVLTVVGYVYTYIRYTCIANTLVIAMDVFLAVSFPLVYHRVVTKFRADMVICAAWLLSLIIYGFCIIFGYYGYRNTLKYIVHNILSLICVVALAFLYAILLWKICIVRKPETRGTSKATGTVVAVLVTYTVLMLPGVWLTLVMKPIFIRPEFFSWSMWFTVIKVFQCLCVLNTVCDPLIYILRLEEIRQEYKIMFFTCKRYFAAKCFKVKGTDVDQGDRHVNNTHSAFSTIPESCVTVEGNL